MKYVNLFNIQNPYPIIFNYKKKSLTEIRLDGKFPANFKDFEIPDLSLVEVVEDTSFRFIVQLKFGVDEDEYVGLYTSPVYYKDLVACKDENNPYFIQNSFDETNVVKFNLNELTRLYNDLKELETGLDVKVSRNIFYNFDAPNDYTHLIKYIDWIIKKPELNDIGKQNVIAVSDISEYEYAQYMVDSGSFEYVDNTINAIRLAKLENELSNTNLSVVEVQDYLENPDSAKLRIPGGAVAKLVGPAGLSILSKVAGTALKATIAKLVPAALLGPVGLIGASVVAAFSLVVKLIGAKKKKAQQDEQIEEHINKLKSELVKLKERRVTLTDEIEKIKK
jgi:hypothetical protein